ncbi:putative amino-acid permease C15C4.04c [Fusarium oxysporum f. sp. albedinis]|nr:putative amino-acid permease C15C4.04c [Fusarium oxysporum f. sp. albedinis]
MATWERCHGLDGRSQPQGHLGAIQGDSEGLGDMMSIHLPANVRYGKPSCMHGHMEADGQRWLKSRDVISPGFGGQGPQRWVPEEEPLI